MDLMKKILPKVLFIGSLLIMLRALFLGVGPDFNVYYHSSIYGSIPNYPPFVVIIFYPFYLLPLVVAYKLWTVLSIVFLLISLYLCFKLFNLKFFSPTALILSSLVFSFFPVKFTLGMGQINLLVLMLVTCAFYFFIKGKDLYSGICLGISIALKLFPVLLLFYFLLKRKYIIFLYTFITFISLGGISYLFIKPEISNYYWQHVFSIFGSTPADYYNQALSGFLARQFDNIFLRDQIKLIISMFFIVFSFWVIFRKNIHDFSRKTLEFGLLITLNVFINGYAWQHHFVWLILPLLIVFFYLKSKKLSIVNYLILGISYLLTAVNFSNPHLLPVIFQSHVFFGSVILWSIITYLLLKYD